MIQRILTGLLAISCVAMVFALYHTANVQISIAEPPPRTPVEFLPRSAIEATLDQRFDTFVLDHATLNDAIKSIAQRSHANLRADWAALGDIGVTQQTLVSCSLHDVTLRGALNFMLYATPTTDNALLGFYTADGIITVTTAEKAARTGDTVTLNIRPLVDAIMATPNFTNLPDYSSSEMPDQAPATAPPSPSTVQGASVFGSRRTTAAFEAATRTEVTEDLMKIITDTVSPETWRDAGGSVGTLRAFDSVLLVTQRREDISSIEELLRNLYSVFTAPNLNFAAHPAAQAAPVFWPADQFDRLLDQPIAEIRFDETPLGKAIAQLADLTHTNVTMSWSSLAGTGVDALTPVTVHLHDITLRQFIKHLGDALPAEGYSIRFSPINNGDFITIDATQLLYGDWITILYNARPLIEDLMRSPDAGATRATLTRQEAADTLMKLITDTMERDSWRDAGGTAGSIRELGGVLIITHSAKLTSEIVEFLDQLHLAMQNSGNAMKSDRTQSTNH